MQQGYEIEGSDRRWTTPGLSSRYLKAVEWVIEKKEGQDSYRTNILSPYEYVQGRFAVRQKNKAKFVKVRHQYLPAMK